MKEALDKAIKEYNEGMAIDEELPLVSDKTRDMAIKFLDFCAASEFRDPSIGITPEGRVAFQWSGQRSAGLFTVGEAGPIYSSAFIAIDKGKYWNPLDDYAKEHPIKLKPTKRRVAKYARRKNNG